MEKFLENLKTMNPIYYAVIALVIILIFLFLFLMKRKSTTKKLKERMAELLIDYNSVKSVPLTFKLNKAIALARVNEAVTEKVTICKEDFELIQGDLSQLSTILADLDDAILSGNQKEAKVNVMDLEGTLERVKGQVTKLDNTLDEVLQKEVEQRARVNDLKERFRLTKESINENRAKLSFSSEALDKQISETEKLFSTFEEWMFVSEFDKAEVALEDIEKSLAVVDSMIVELPDLLAIAQGIIPELIDEVSQLYSKCKQKGLVLEHLEIPTTLEMISQTLKDDLSRLRKGEVEGVAAHLEENKKRLVILIQQLEREEVASTELEGLQNTIDERMAQLEKVYADSILAYEKVSDKFDFSATFKELEIKRTEIDQLTAESNQLRDVRNSKEKPASEYSTNYKEFLHKVTISYNELVEIYQSLNSVRSDEERARKQLLKLHLIMNEIQVKIQRYRLPNISADCDGDIQRAYSYINSIEDLLNESALNLPLLNGTLSEAIDYIYKLYNNVNNIVGMAIMVENTIVFGNRYRSTYHDIDSELTRAELAYRNGEYTQALTIAIRAVEKIHPGSYEQLIKENSGSVA